jgi:hypothetical protein
MRFTIRDVLWLTVVAALVLGWWVERRAKVEALRDARGLAHLAVFGPGQKHVEHWRQLVRKYGAYELTPPGTETRPFVKMSDTWDGK